MGQNASGTAATTTAAGGGATTATAATAGGAGAVAVTPTSGGAAAPTTPTSGQVVTLPPGTDPAAILVLLHNCVLFQRIYEISASDTGASMHNPDGTLATGSQRLFRLLHFNAPPVTDLRAYDFVYGSAHPGTAFVSFWGQLPYPVFELGLRRGANPNALSRAADGGFVPAILQLFQANIGSGDASTHAKIMALIAAGVNLETRDERHQNTLLLYACWEGWDSIARALMDAGARVAGVRNRYGDDALLRLAKHGSPNRLSDQDCKLAETLILKGADLTSENNDRVTALSAAARSRKIKLVLLLLKRGATLPALAASMNSPIHLNRPILTPKPIPAEYTQPLPAAGAVDPTAAPTPAITPAAAAAGVVSVPRAPLPVLTTWMPTVAGVESDAELNQTVAELAACHTALAEWLGSADLLIPIAGYLIGSTDPTLVEPASLPPALSVPALPAAGIATAPVAAVAAAPSPVAESSAVAAVLTTSEPAAAALR